jgi:hypothetical protein
MTGSRRDKRKHHRIQFDGDITLHPVMPSQADNVLEVQSQGISAKGSDISEEGLRLEIGDTRSPGDILKVKFSVEKFKSVDAYGKLAWKKGNYYGLHFFVLDSDSRSQIREYIDKRK